jgi:hypothetical protein
VRKHTPKRVPECLRLMNHIIFVTIFSPIDLKKRLSRRDTDKRFHLSTAHDKVKTFHKSSMRYIGTARYGHIDSFGKFEQGFTLVLSRISCIASGLALLEDEQKFKHGGCVGSHKIMISCANISSKYIK